MNDRTVTPEMQSEILDLIDEEMDGVLEDDINENGYTEKFQQGNQEPYDRKRPNAETYKSFYDSYLKTVKQLTDMLPKAEPKPETDEFDEFISGRSEI